MLYDGWGVCRTSTLISTTTRFRLPSTSSVRRSAGPTAILFCTPEYAGALPGSFKNLLDWTIGDEHPGSIYRKPVAWINVSASATGAADAHESLGKVLGYAHADVIAAACVRIPVRRHMIDGDGLIGDPAIRRDALNALSLLSDGRRATRTAASRRSERFVGGRADSGNGTPKITD